MATGSANVLTQEENDAVRKLYARCVEEKIRVDSVFELGLYVIVAKCDVEKALGRIRKYRKVEEECEFRTIDGEEAMQFLNHACPEFLQPAGKRKDGGAILAAEYRNFIAKAAHKDIRLTLKACLMYLEAGVCDLEEARHGASLIADCEKIGWGNFSFEVEKKFSEVYQDSFPIRFNSIVMVNSPLLINALINLCKPFLKKKLRERIITTKKSDLASIATPDNLPPVLGGTYSGTAVDWLRSRHERIKQSTAECQCEGVKLPSQ